MADEAHAGFLPRNDDGSIDAHAARKAGELLKMLILDSNGRTLWAATGSNMATFWTSVAKIPTNGYCLLVHQWKVSKIAVTLKGHCHPSLYIGSPAKDNPPDDDNIFFWKNRKLYSLSEFLFSPFSVGLAHITG